MLLWGVALAIEYVSPALGFYVPGFGRSTTREWDVKGPHLAERCGNFIIIALGESILISGATFAKGPLNAATIGALAATLSGCIAMWWLYFNIGAERGTQRIGSAEDPGRLARLLYTYIHLLIVGGIIVSAAGDELVLAHPSGHTSVQTSIAVLGSSAAFLLGNLLFKRAIWHSWPLSHIGGLAMLGALSFAAPSLAPVALALSTSAVLIVVAAWESRAVQREERGRDDEL